MGKVTDKMIRNYIIEFHKKIEDDEHHRYLSWEHCYSFFHNEENRRKLKNSKKTKLETTAKNSLWDLACLHLGFYLASWGMLRGSSDLLQKDYTFYKCIIEVLLNDNFKDCWLSNGFFCQNNNQIINRIFDLKSELEKRTGSHVSNKNKNILISKILLGTTGCTPAYDTYFKNGLRNKYKKHGIQTFGKRSLKYLIGFYKKHKKTIDAIKIKTKDTKIPYPIMKKIDMFFWVAGRP